MLPSVAAGAPPSTADSTRAVAPVTLRLPADVVYDRAVGPDRAVVFSHATHFGFAGNRCTACHPQPFLMLKPTHRASHAEMNAGRSCGTCHDGRLAFGVRDSSTCTTCHSGRGSRDLAAGVAAAPGAAAAAAPRGPKPHAYPMGESSPGRVTFKHETHLRGANACASCHPRPFGMKFTAPRPDGGMHEASACGACHDGKKTFGTEDPATCARCHAEAGERP